MEDELTELLIGRSQRDEAPVKQRIWDACLILHARSERYERLVGGPDIDNKIRLERQHRFKVCRITAPGNAPNFRPPADVRQHVSALFWTVGSTGASVYSRMAAGGPAGNTRSTRACIGTDRPALSSTIAARALPGISRHHLPIITAEALMTAQASSPTRRLRSATASLVIEDVTMTPPPISMRTWDVVAPFATSTIFPLS